MTAEARPGFKDSRKVKGVLVTEHEQGLAPAMPRIGNLEVRLAESMADVEACQRLRYHIFYEELCAKATPAMALLGRDFDKYDEVCDHLLVLDHARPRGDQVVGTYRLIREDMARKVGGFYSQGEYDLDTMCRKVPAGTKFLELGRSCVHAEYRTKPTIELLWLAILSYVAFHDLNVMVGCASLPGTDPDALKVPLAFLHHTYLAPEPWRARAHERLYVPMNVMRKEDVDLREALRKLPPLVKGYVRAGGFVGDGAVIDHQFNTTDVLIIFPLSELTDRYKSRFGRVAALGAEDA